MILYACVCLSDNIKKLQLPAIFSLDNESISNRYLTGTNTLNEISEDICTKGPGRFTKRMNIFSKKGDNNEMLVMTANHNSLI